MRVVDIANQTDKILKWDKNRNIEPLRRSNRTSDKYGRYTVQGSSKEWSETQFC